MIVPGGGISKMGNWRQAKSKGKYLFPVKALSLVYRAKFMEKLIGLLKEKELELSKELRNQLYQKSWVVYAKSPFLGPKQVIEYLGRYSHKIAISNHRIVSVQDGKVSFRYKDYRKGAKQCVMTLDAEEFLRRFCLHFLPKGFRKIRHYGFLASRNKPKLRIQQFVQGQNPVKKEKPNWKTLCREKLNFDVESCPCCISRKMLRVLNFQANAPPLEHLLPPWQKQVPKN